MGSLKERFFASVQSPTLKQKIFQHIPATTPYKVVVAEIPIKIKVQSGVETRHLKKDDEGKFPIPQH